MEHIKSQKGKQNFAFEGYMYIFDSKMESKTYWKCESGTQTNFIILVMNIYETIWTMISVLKNQILFSIFFYVFQCFFHIFFFQLKVISIFCLIRCVDNSSLRCVDLLSFDV